MKEALIIIDVQNDYFQGGKIELENPLDALKNIEKLLSKFRAEKKEVIFIQHISVREDAGFFLEKTEGAEIHKKILPLQSEKVIIKNYPNSFFYTELDKFLKEKAVESLVITGMMTHMCVDSTTRAAKDLGYKCTVIKDCCATRDFIFEENIVTAREIQNSFMTALGYYYADILSTKEYLENR
jgi:nicotinamidase-related amidase